MEGEPYPPSIFSVLGLIERNSQTLIQLTTNGSYLDYSTVVKLKEYMSLWRCLSLNAGSEEMRKS